MRKKLYPVALAIAALLVPGAGTASADGDGKALRITATVLQSQYVDEAPAGPSQGDEFVFSERLFKDRRHVGMSGVVCTVTHAVPPYGVLTLQCVATLSLRRGQITLQGLVEAQSLSDPGPFTLAITGGTGEYRGASGEAVVRRGPGVAVYKLRLDSAKKHKSHKKKHKPRKDRGH